MPPRVLALARDLTATEPTPYDRARALESYLHTFPYSKLLILCAALPHWELGGRNERGAKHFLQRSEAPVSLVPAGALPDEGARAPSH